MHVKVKHALCNTLFRVLLPLVLLAAAVVRFNVFSLLYLLLVLAAPLLPSPTSVTVAGKTGRYLMLSAIICTCTLTAQVVFYLYSFAIATPEEPFGTWLKNCSHLEQGLRQLGLQRLEPNDYENILRITLPDIGTFIITVLVLALCKCLLPEAVSGSVSPRHSRQSIMRQRLEGYWTYILNMFGNILIGLFLAGSGVTNPSALSAVYFLMFLGLSTWWACNKKLGARFAVLRILLLVYTGAHIVLLYLYQFQFFQEILNSTSLVARVVGLNALVQTNCRKPWMLTLNDKAEWWMFASPAIILMLYFTLACKIRCWAAKTPLISISTQSSPHHVSSSGGGIARRTRVICPERQVLDPENEKALVEDRHHSYNSTDMADNSSICPRPEIYSMDTDCEKIDGAAPDIKIRSAMASVFVYIMTQSYVSTLIVMMVWSITYHSWLTFVFLLAACIIWMIPQKRNICLCVSPIIVCYAQGILLIQYVYGFNLTVEELPTETASGYKYAQIGMMKVKDPCLHIALQIAFTVCFMLTLRQYMRELHLKRDMHLKSVDYRMHDLLIQGTSDSNFLPITMGDVIDGQDSDGITEFGNWLWHMLCKYWIMVCAILLLVISIQEPVIYRIIYLGFFLYFVITFQLCNKFWRFCMFVFWWIVIVYSMVVLLCIYTYQFENFPEYWMNGTGMSPEVLSDLGLETFSIAQLFAKLVTPTMFVIIICIQVQYFHEPFLKLSDVKHFRLPPTNDDEVIEDTAAPGPSEEEVGVTTATDAEAPDTLPELSYVPVKNESTSTSSARPRPSKQQLIWDRLKKTVLLFNALLDRISVKIWRILEIHIFKIVMFTIFISSVSEICVINTVLVVIVAVLMPVTVLHPVLSHLCQCYTGIVLLAKMIYQLKFISPELGQSNCTSMHNLSEHQLPYPFNETINTTDYVGFKKTDNLDHYLMNYVLIVVIIGFEAIVKLHQTQYFNKPDTPRPPVGIVFNSIRHNNVDEGLLPCAKYFINYFFYKFGLETCFIMTVVTMVIRLDAYSVLYGLFLAVLLCLRRRHCYRVWPIYVLILIILLILQYLSCVGVPAALCWEYPWDTVPEITTNLKFFLYLPNYVDSPDSYLLIADFFQLLFVCLQWNVFSIENGDNSEEYPGGSNRDILEQDSPNKTHDFFYCKVSYLDYLKAVIFPYSFWVTLAVVFIAGTAKISLFCLGYLVGFFFFLWFGMMLLTKPLRTLVKLWSFMLGYTFFVILSKSCLQLVGCVYLARVADGYCWVIQLLGLGCIHSRNYINVQEDNAALKSCNQSDDEVGMMWDAICFVFLLVQLRIYKSHYFKHVILELEVQQSLASRGAELINTTLIKEVNEQKNRKEQKLARLKNKMERIRKRQEHQCDQGIKPTEDHNIVIKSGDRYMFTENEEFEDSTDGIIDEDSESDGEEKAGKIINAAMYGSLKEALQVAEGRCPDEMVEKLPKTIDPEIHFEFLEGNWVVSKEDEVDGDDETSKSSKSKGTCCVKFCGGLKVAGVFIGSIMDSMIKWLKGISRKYIAVSRILDHEKEAEKIKRRRARGDVPFEPEVTVDPEADEWRLPDSDDTPSHSKTHSKREVTIVIDITEPESSSSTSKPKTIELGSTDTDKQNVEFASRMPRILQLLLALWQAIWSHSELVCYFAMFLNMLVNASLLSLPYPLSVFLWAMLSVPRPSKFYWVTIMTYTEAVVVVKYLFQFGFFPWNDSKVEVSPFWPPRILGIEKQNGYAVFDLVLLFCLFIHRSILNGHGLWKDATDIDADFDLAVDKVASRGNTPATTPATSPTTTSEHVEPSTVLPESGGDMGEDNAVFDGSIRTSQGSSVELAVIKEKEGCCSPLGTFYQQMTNPKYNMTTNVYSAMFFCDFINFFIILLGYWAFGPVESAGSKENVIVTKVIVNNRVPAPFLAMLLVQFILIVIDRAIYIRKKVFSKLIFQICLVFAVHIWLFFILPAVTHRAFTNNLPAQLWYFTKCIYFGLSAYQIKSGYPNQILGNFLARRYNYFHLILFKGFLIIPFLLELRALMDWIWTETTLSITSWLKMEDIYASTYELKCWRWGEKKYPRLRGIPVRKVTKYGVGGSLLFVLICIIWFPLLLFSLSSAVFEPNPPVDCTIEMKFGSFQPIFMMSAQQLQLHPISTAGYYALKDRYSGTTSGTSFFANYQNADIYVAEINGVSTATWDISPPSEESLHDDLENKNIDIKLFTTISFERLPKSGMTSDTVSKQFVRLLKATDPAMMRIREELANMINKTFHDPDKFIEVTSVFPQYLQVPVNGPPTVALPWLGSEDQLWSNVSFNKESHRDVMWWIIRDSSPAHHDETPQQSLNIILFNERVAPSVLTILTNYGILGLYLSLILVIGRFIRVQTSGLTRDIMFNFLPNVDQMWILINDIYLVREAGEYRLEEELFSKLMFLYRSPDTLIDFTRHPKIKQD